MENFRFENTTKIIFGRKSHENVGMYTKEYSERLLIIYGSGSIKKSGVYDQIVESIKREGIEIFEVSGIAPNPCIDKVYEGIEICREKNIKFILAIGGGSVIDTAKAVALGVDYEGDVWDFFDRRIVTPQISIKIGVILTIPASGSETSASTVISKEVNGIPYKRDYSNNLLRPKFAILNPEITMTLSIKQTMCGGVDIMAHVMERYFTNVKNVELTDRLCEATLITVINNLRKLIVNPKDYNARAEIMWAGTIAHNNILSTGRRSDWSSHMIEHELSAIYNIPHGSGLAIIFPAWMKYVYRNDLMRFSQFASRVWDIEINYENLEETAIKGISATEDFLLR